MKEGIDLTRLWSLATGIRVESLSPTSDMFIFLRVDSKEMPASYLTPDPWFLMCRKMKPGLWEVGLREKEMRAITGANAEAVADIMNNLKRIANTRPIEIREWFPVVFNMPSIVSEKVSPVRDIFIPNQEFVPKI